jgi:hypothetical protein
MGVDGVFKTVSDEFNAYQAKFRKDRVSLTWSELSTFMGLTDKVNQRVLFTNSKKGKGVKSPLDCKALISYNLDHGKTSTN